MPATSRLSPSPSAARVLSGASLRPLLTLLLLLLAAFALAPAASAETIELNQPAVRAALRAYGWKPEATDYLLGYMRLVETDARVPGVCPTAVACTTPAGVLYLNLATDDSTTFNYVINHEMIHAMQFARGDGDGVVGGELADLLSLSADPSYPAAAASARRILGLSGTEDYPVLDQRDWFHMDHDLLQDVGWDVRNLPAWFAQAYFPYLTSNPASATAPRAPTAAAAPVNLGQRRQRVLDTVLSMCGPTIPGARLLATASACGPSTGWTASPYPAFTTVGATASNATPPVALQRPVGNGPAAGSSTAPTSVAGVASPATDGGFVAHSGRPVQSPDASVDGLD